MCDDDVPPTASKAQDKAARLYEQTLAVASTAYNELPDHVILRQEKEDMYMEALY
ncbi:BZ3500_MvSof-1268-A1-R1_Chr4-1g06720 [Microbotryum saponariae]|uniref:BZ3500_MvSof-1268-A1-R1_Chr4-1g06684 protein n=1 Tax=Microbotryum saponariae TaxID=289078 RepID=A0A2X0KUS2_9BASI|nr:BZ3500_MvSof-1268-A1-R1_Chr4-1g06684 [Microbotryum saponariae]SCZ96787.1 BZ3500_MvSof-1268-A1-R1_Chr4-1g06720 [Microbotryum saponariae]SDA06349.1 BZ3501_MvSof-1269-A2-R1_Chr4-1g06394 [Microbotryum saponariae]SDA06385.1 BZ3501_MvSof-1269-A2-R1_Chr4-1g06430 [Microbotryum saponariae]